MITEKLKETRYWLFQPDTMKQKTYKEKMKLSLNEPEDCMGHPVGWTSQSG